MKLTYKMTSNTKDTNYTWPSLHRQRGKLRDIYLKPHIGKTGSNGENRLKRGISKNILEETA